jgi:hypothetical protein
MKTTKHLKNGLIFILVAAAGMAVSPFVGKNKAAAEEIQTPSEKNMEKPKKLKKSVVERQTILAFSDSVCNSLGVPPKLIREIGNNESGWRYIKNTNGGTDMGDLQVIDKTFDYWYNRLELEGGKTRENYVIVGIHYLKYNFNRYKSWKKARFAYARGSWRDESTWTCLEEKFMKKIDWSQYGE